MTDRSIDREQAPPPWWPAHEDPHWCAVEHHLNDLSPLNPELNRELLRGLFGEAILAGYFRTWGPPDQRDPLTMARLILGMADR